MCDLATNWCCKSSYSRNSVPAFGVVFNITGEENNRKADRKVDCQNCGGTNITRDCTRPSKKDGYRKGKVNVTFKDDYDDDYGDGVILTCFENRLPEFLEDCDDMDIADAELGINDES